MWIICDDKNVVQDRASIPENLSRGYQVAGVPVGDEDALTIAGFKRYEITATKLDIRVMDSYDDEKIIPNVRYRAGVELIGIESQLIDETLRKEKAIEMSLSQGTIDSLTGNVNLLSTRKSELDTIINAS